MINFKHPKTPLLVLACTTAIFSALPVSFDFNTKEGFMRMSPAFALAESENDGDEDGVSDGDGAADGSNGGAPDNDSDGDTGASDGGSSSDDGDNDTGTNDTGTGTDDADEDQSGSVGTGNEGNGTPIVKFESTEHSLHAVFANGTSVEIMDGQYERKDAAGNTLEERRATQADADRIVALR